MKILTTLLSLVVCAGTASAAVLAQYTFDGTRTGNVYDPTGTNTLLNPSNVAADITAGDLGQAGPVAWRFQNGFTNISIYPGNTAVNSSSASGSAITTAADAVTQASYITFTLSTTGGAEMDLTSLTFDAARGGNGSRGFAIQTSATGFSTDGSTNLTLGGAISSGAFTALTTNYPTYTPISLDLSGAAFQNLTTIEVRIFSYSAATTSSIEYDSFTVNGTVVVPEPHALSLAVGSAGCLLLFRRRRRPALD